MYLLYLDEAGDFNGRQNKNRAVLAGQLHPFDVTRE